MLNKILKWGAVALLVFFVVTQPAEAANVTRSIGNGLVTVANGFGAFVSNVV